jgi:hypothetical protein
MIKYLAGDKVRVVRSGHYRIVDVACRDANIEASQTVILLVEKNWPPDGWWHALWGRTTVFIHESDFELPSLLETLARAAAEPWEI